MTMVVIARFWPSYLRQITRGNVQRHWVIHLHALVYSGWMVLLMTQVILVFQRQIRVHRAFGRVGIAYGVLVLLMGLVVSVVATVLHVSSGEWNLDRGAAFLALPR
jgi:hypothetical protein